MKKNGTAISYENSHRPHLIYHRLAYASRSRFSFNRLVITNSSRLCISYLISPSVITHAFAPTASSPHPHIDVIRYELDNDISNTGKNELNKTAHPHQLTPPHRANQNTRNKTPPAPTPYDGKRTPSPPPHTARADHATKTTRQDGTERETSRGAKRGTRRKERHETPTT